MKDKLKCQECGWRGMSEQLLIAPNPFEPAEDITGCPKCKAIDQTQPVCEVDGCWSFVSAGFNTDKGYMCTCSEHRKIFD